VLQAYIGSYTQHTKIDRLLFIADHYQGKPLELEALKLAADEVKQVRNPLVGRNNC
jgi:COP9 signalosome complex subunit 1